jgi:hypothetical protein
LLTEPESDVNSAPSSNRITTSLPTAADSPEDWRDSSNLPPEILEIFAVDSSFNDEVVRLTSSNAFDACKVFNYLTQHWTKFRSWVLFLDSE